MTDITTTDVTDVEPDSEPEWRVTALAVLEIVAVAGLALALAGLAVWARRTIDAYGPPWWALAAAASVPAGLMARLALAAPRAARRALELHEAAARRVVGPPSSWLDGLTRADRAGGSDDTDDGGEE